MNIVDISQAREVAKQAARMIKPLRTERTLRHMAKDFAAAWWDESVKLGDGVYLTQKEKEFAEKRSEMFRAMWPDQQIYVTICWPHFYQQARQQSIAMLRPDSGQSELMKQRVYDAIIEDHQKNG